MMNENTAEWPVCPECQFELRPNAPFYGGHQKDCSRAPTDSEDDAIEAIIKEFCNSWSKAATHPASNGLLNWLRTALRSYGDKVREEENNRGGYRQSSYSQGKKVGRRETLDKLAEKVKSVNGDPFEDSEEMLECYMYLKAKILALIAEMRK